MIGLALVALLGAPFIVPLFSPWSRVNCREFELDLVSGQQRVPRYLYGIPVHRELRATAASDALCSAVTMGSEVHALHIAYCWQGNDDVHSNLKCTQCIIHIANAQCILYSAML